MSERSYESLSLLKNFFCNPDRIGYKLVCLIKVAIPLSSEKADMKNQKLISCFRVFGNIDWELWILLVVPLILVLINSEWIFTNAFLGFIDPWIYFGYFLDYPRYLHIFPNTYYGTRLPWILPGYYVFHFLPPILSNYILHLGAYYTSTISLYLILKYTISRRAGLLAAVLMGCYPAFLGAVGWDYPDGASIAYFLLTLLMLTCAAKFSRWRMFLCLGGAFYGALIYLNLYWIPFTPVFVLHYFFINREYRKNSILLSILLFISGILAVTFVLGVFNYTHNRNFLFFLPTIQYLTTLRFSQDASYYNRSYTTWIPKLAYLRPIIAIGVSSLLFLLFHFFLKKDRKVATKDFLLERLQTRLKLLYQASFLFCILIMIGLELKGWPAFQYFYYATSIIPCMFLALGAQISSITDRLNSKLFIILLVAAASLLPVLKFKFLGIWFANPIHLQQLAVLSFVLLLAGFVNLVFRSRHQVGLGFLALLLVMLTSTSFSIRSAGVNFNPLEIGSAREGYQAVVQSVKAVRTYVPEIKKIIRQGNRLFWYDGQTKFGGLYRSISSTYLWLGLLVNESFPSLEDIVTKQPVINLAPDTKLVILSEQEDVVERANKALKQIGLGVQVLHQEQVQAGKSGFTMTFIKAVKL
ncbi:MAG: hypothetical protein WCA35_29140 [Kovacikia sp.]